MHSRVGRIRCFLAAVLVCGTALTVSAQSDLPQDLFSRLKYRHVGPIGNRVSAVVGVPGDANVYYIGAASGGVFKTADGGVSWDPVFDAQPALSVGALAIAPSDPNVVWVGTGEAHIRSNVSIGNGVYRSTDAGKTWTHLGLEKTGRISRLVVHPDDPDIALVAALGSLYGPQQERGVFKTVDGGKHWRRVLFSNENSGASDIVMDPNNPRILYAGLWEMRIWTWGRRSGGPGSGLYRSVDEGETWKQLTGQGLPEPSWGKVALSMSARNSDRIFALIETNVNDDFEPLEEHQGVLWRSDDSGKTWKMINADHTLVQRPHYYSRVYVSPHNQNEVHFLATQHSKSIDGGVTSARFPSGGDHHDIWIDPLIPDRMIVGHDQGIGISSTAGSSWFRPQLPIAQMYHVATDQQIPYYLYGNRQDGASARGPSNSLTRGPIPVGAWHAVGGCESGFAIPDPVDNNIVWSGCYEGILDRYDHRTGHVRNVSVWPDNPEAWPGEDLKYRFQWTFPIAISPHDHTRVYAGSQFVHVTEDGGNSWRVISPDLTSNEKARQKKWGGLTPDDEGPTIWPALFAIAESPLQEGVVWAGSNDGRLHVTRNGGRDWVHVTDNIPGLPPLGTISNIEPSRHRKGRAYISVDLHQVNDTNPYIYRTDDYGRSWMPLHEDIPKSVFSYVHCVREDPTRQGLLYAGTENSLYVSFDDGGRWHSLQSNLPHAPVHWLTIQEHFNDLVVATYGRGFWILDDLTPLQELNLSILGGDAHLFQPRSAYRFRPRVEPRRQPNDPAAGTNPTYGASIHYFLGKASETLEITIEDGAGEQVRKLETPAGKAGLHRVYWDLRYDAVERPKLRTRPLQHSHVPLGEKGFRLLTEGPSQGVLAAPGTYTVRFKWEGGTSSRQVEVLKDPNSAGTLSDLETQTELVLDLRQMSKESVELIEALERARQQLAQWTDRTTGKPGQEALLAEARQLEQQLRDLEGNLFDLRLTPARQDTLWWPRKLYSKILLLMRVVQQSDFAPTSQQRAVYLEYKGRLATLERDWQSLREGPIQEFNHKARAAGWPSFLN